MTQAHVSKLNKLRSISPYLKERGLQNVSSPDLPLVARVHIPAWVDGAAVEDRVARDAVQVVLEMDRLTSIREHFFVNQ